MDLTIWRFDFPSVFLSSKASMPAALIAAVTMRLPLGPVSPPGLITTVPGFDGTSQQSSGNCLLPFLATFITVTGAATRAKATTTAVGSLASTSALLSDSCD